jgi:hypothetical protein
MSARCPQYRKDHAPSTSGEVLTDAGRLVILHNVFAGIHTDFDQLKYEMSKDDSSAMIYNSLVFRVASSLESLLDSIARLCDDLYSMQSVSSDDIYFHSYGFYHPEFNRLRIHYTNICNLVYNGGTFNSFAKTIKHVPWVGLRTMNSQGVVDIYDEANIGLVDNFLDILIKNTWSLLQKLEFIVIEKERYDQL